MLERNPGGFGRCTTGQCNRIETLKDRLNLVQFKAQRPEAGIDIRKRLGCIALAFVERLGVGLDLFQDLVVFPILFGEHIQLQPLLF